MITEIVTTTATLISVAWYLTQAARRKLPHTPHHHSVAAIQARLEGEKRIAAASKHEAARLTTALTC
ncbi:hypothetical protein ACWDUL_06785 [Nocardia niigatensis]|uniref:hypothetical protein n=1 Tax=Nocardia niigatensis TaxID=209249 RepID=UPI000316CF83|nr:hypothetical protein [Nocardia niigatensis]